MTDTAAVRVLAGFALAVRCAGVPVTTDRSRSFVEAASLVGMADTGGVYWAGRATLCAEPDHITPYDRVFESWFSRELPRRVPSRRPAAQRATSGLDDTDTSGGATPAESLVDVVRAAASDADILRTRDIADLTPSERAALAELFTRLRPRPPLRRAPRRRPARRGDIDARRTMREELRLGGEPGRLRHRSRSRRPRRVVVLLDVSGSMSSYADALLRLAHVWVRATPQTVEVFTVGTRLTRVTRALRALDPDAALREAGEQVPDWSGGTRLGEVLGAFLDRWGQRGTARGAVVVLCSDGWERGDPGLLAAQMARLHRLAHRVVWVNPHRGKPGYAPVQAGIVASLPFVDAFVAGHSLATFADLMEVVADA